VTLSSISVLLRVDNLLDSVLRSNNFPRLDLMAFNFVKWQLLLNGGNLFDVRHCSHVGSLLFCYIFASESIYG
jgi:hypothetical protein